MSDDKLKIAIAGVSGRLGRAIAAETIRSADLDLVGGMVSSDSSHIDQDLGDLAGTGFLGVDTVVAFEQAADPAQVVIDATSAKVTASIAPRLGELGGRALVTGVTGLDAEQQAALESAAKTIPVLQASNFSLGVALMERLVAEAARALSADLYDLEIVETHHKRKLDAPSGTAITLGEAAAKARGAVFDRVAQYERARQGASRPVGTIGFSAVRGGGVVGEHDARFLSAFEEVSVSHRAFDRIVFAQGAMHAVRWIADKPAGFYTMQDVLG